MTPTPEFTPGPWKPVECAVTMTRAVDYVADLVRGATDTEAHLHVVTQASEDVTSDGHIVVAVVGNGPTSRTNARLIAAAPDLIAALERVVLGAIHPQCAEPHSSPDCQCAQLIALDALNAAGVGPSSTDG